MLTAADFKTATWARLVQVKRVRLQELLEELALDADPIKTATTRGRVAELKRDLDLADDASSGDEPLPGLGLGGGDLLGDQH